MKYETFAHLPYLVKFSRDVKFTTFTLYRNHLFSFCDNLKLSTDEFEFLIFINPLEFFTRKWVGQNFRANKNFFISNLRFLIEEGYVEKIISDKNKLIKTEKGMEKVKDNKYAITAKGINEVNKFYKEIEKGYNAECPRLNVRYYPDERREHFINRSKKTNCE